MSNIPTLTEPGPNSIAKYFFSTGDFDFSSSASKLTYITLVAICVLYFFSGGPNVTTGIFVGLIFGQSTFVATWFFLARHWSRFSYAVIALSVLGWLLASIDGRFDLIIFFLPFMNAIPIVLTVEIIKFTKGRFAMLDSHGQEDYQEGIQFTVRQLIILTTSIALLLGIWNAIGPAVQELFSRSRVNGVWPLFVAIGCTVATITLVSIWSLLGHWKSWRPAAALLVGSLAIFLCCKYAAPSRAINVWVTMFVVCWFFLIILMLLLRYDGYRFIRHSIPND